MHSSLRFSRSLLLALTGLLASGCTDFESTSVSLSAFTQTRAAATDPVAGMSLVLDASREAAALELADGTVVDLELGASQLETSPDACEGDNVASDRHVMAVLNRPLTVGDRVFEAPVLETGCGLDAASGPVLLREADAAACDGDACISFATPEELPTWQATGATSPSQLPIGSAIDPVANCTPSYSVCESCGGGKTRSRNVQMYSEYVQGNPGYMRCRYVTSYGTCGVCAL